MTDTATQAEEVVELEAENEKLLDQVAELEAENEKLLDQVAELEAENEKLRGENGLLWECIALSDVSLGKRWTRSRNATTDCLPP